jgi:Spy/CpxP family protein refolding chaperone
MRSWKRVGSTLALLAGLTVPGASLAQPPHGGPHHHGNPGRLVEEHADQLGLDSETREAIRAIVRDSREAGDVFRSEQERLHRKMRELLEADEPNEHEVMRLADAIGRVETTMHKHRLSTLLAIRRQLTPEQRAELVEMRKDERGRFGHPIAEACDADRERLCPAAEDRWSRRRCMRESWDELSEECQEAIESRKHDRRSSRRRWRTPKTG